MALIYALITWMGAQSRGAYPLSANGGIALATSPITILAGPVS